MFKFNKQLYSKIALMKAAYNFTDVAYVHLDTDNDYYYVMLTSKKDKQEITEKEFVNEMLAQSVRHEIYKQTKNIREILLARAMASSILLDENFDELESEKEYFTEDEILKDWFEK